MPKIWEPQDISVYKKWVEDIEYEASDDLTDWENNFIESISTRLSANRNLTQGQAETLEKIYVAKTS